MLYTNIYRMPPPKLIQIRDDDQIFVIFEGQLIPRKKSSRRRMSQRAKKLEVPRTGAVDTYALDGRQNREESKNESKSFATLSLLVKVLEVIF